jgi:TatD DNase family protein
MEWIDCHNHMQDPSLMANLDSVLEHARRAGVSRLVCNGSAESDWEDVLKLAQTHPEVMPSFGLHPWYVHERSSQWLPRLEEFLDRVPSAVGEIGLDRWIEPRNEVEQEAVFREQLRLARRRQLPATIHCLRAWGWLMDVLRAEGPFPAGFVLHAYGGSTELIQPLVEWGAYFSFAGTVLEAKRERAREALRQVPADRLLLETDAPDLLPPEAFRSHVLHSREGKLLNEPGNLAAIGRGIAALRGVTEAQLAETVWENTGRLFRTVWK